VDGSQNAALLAVRILALSDDRLRAQLVEHAAELRAVVAEKDARLRSDRSQE